MKKITGSLVSTLAVTAVMLVGQFFLTDFANASYLNDSLWRDIKVATDDTTTDPVAANSAIGAKKSAEETSSKELRARRLAFDEASFRKRIQHTLGEAPAAKRDLSQTLIVPMPDGTSEQVKLIPNALLPPALAKRYPAIRTWTLQGTDNPAIRGRADLTLYGFHAMLVLEDGDTVFVERETQSQSGIYHAFSSKENPQFFSKSFNCHVPGHAHDSPLEHAAEPTELAQKVAAREALPLITYRLAIAATGEYTFYHGGSVAKALSAIVTTINRVNEINERDLGVRFQLIAEQDQIIYTNPFTDPYSNGDAGAMLEENMLNLSSLGDLNESAFDVGHVFGQGPPAGFAFVGSACNKDFKAGAVTASPNPFGDAFNIDFVAHELGHQLGATHTFNSDTLSCGGGNRTPESAVEPGSGSTLMAYAGICGTNDLQANSDAMYHAISIGQINGYTRNSAATGASCGVRTGVSNEAPSANAGDNATIPANTPFLLEGSGSDLDNDALTFAWDQQDAGAISSVNVDTGDNAIIRSFLPSTAANRFVPALTTLFGGTSIKGEILPRTQRQLNFSLTVRDGKGGIGSDSLTLNVQPMSSSFMLTSHTVPQSFIRGQTTTVNWNVASTNFSPFNCSQVDIGLLTPSGLRVTLGRFANNGSAPVKIPDDVSSMSRARFMVMCASAPFFNVSAADLEILGQSDTIPPVIELLGFNPVKVVVGSSYMDAGVTAVDDFDASVTINRTGTVETSTVGTYELVYTAIDDAGNSATVTRIVNVVAEEESEVETPIVSGGGGGGALPWYLPVGLLLLGVWRRFNRQPLAASGDGR